MIFDKKSRIRSPRQPRRGSVHGPECKSICTLVHVHGSAAPASLRPGPGPKPRILDFLSKIIGFLSNNNVFLHSASQEHLPADGLGAESLIFLQKSLVFYQNTKVFLHFTCCRPVRDGAQLAGWLARVAAGPGRLARPAGAQLASWLAGVSWLTGWLACWLAVAGWFAGWLAGWLGECGGVGSGAG